jgi:hypothetical protein
VGVLSITEEQKQDCHVLRLIYKVCKRNIADLSVTEMQYTIFQSFSTVDNVKLMQSSV